MRDGCLRCENRLEDRRVVGEKAAVNPELDIFRDQDDGPVAGPELGVALRLDFMFFQLARIGMIRNLRDAVGLLGFFLGLSFEHLF